MAWCWCNATESKPQNVSNNCKKNAIQMKNFKLISIKEHSKKDQRDKSKKLYSWYLQRYHPEIEFKYFMDVMPSQPKNCGIQLLKSEIISEINSRNVFDFPFEPKDEDFLFLQNIRDNEDFLSLYFVGEKWKEDVKFTISNNEIEIGKGIFEIE